MNLSPDTIRIQQRFSQYCRTGEKTVLPGAKPDRLQHYRRLVFNVVKDALETAFPITSGFLPAKRWLVMVEHFFGHHPCQSYQVWKLPHEFYEYALQQKWAEKYSLPFLPDLLYFEWIEMELYNMEDLPVPACSQQGNWLKDVLVLNPEFRLLKLEYPVHLYPPAVVGTKKGLYFVVQYRHPESGNVHFVQLSPWLAFVIEQIHCQQLSLEALLPHAPTLFDIKELKVLQTNTVEFLKKMKQEQLVAGFKIQ